MHDIRTQICSGLLCLSVGGAAPALAFDYPCSLRDRSYAVMSDCYFNTWQGIVDYYFQGGGGSYGVGYLYGRNDCDSGGLNCDGSSRPFRLYKATKLFQQWISWGNPDVVNFWWNINGQHLHWDYCRTPAGEDAHTVTQYTFPYTTGWYVVWCNW